MDRQTYLRTGLTPIDYAEVIANHQQCPIDLTDFAPESDIVKLTCGHIFCRDCILTWLETTSTCPYCRRELFDQSDSPAGSDDETLVDEAEDSDNETLVAGDEDSDGEILVDEDEDSDDGTLVDEEDDDPSNRHSPRQVQQANRYNYQLDEFVVPDQPEAAQREEDFEHYGPAPVELQDDDTSDEDSEYDDDDHDEEMLDLT